MKSFIFVLLFVLGTSLVSADDLSDTKQAFATLIEYQKTDDLRTLDLFSKDCAVTLTFSDGKVEKSAVIPSEEFFNELKKDIARKAGNKEVYEDIKYTLRGRLSESLPKFDIQSLVSSLPFQLYISVMRMISLRSMS